MQETPEPVGSRVSYVLRQDMVGCLRNSVSRTTSGLLDYHSATHPLARRKKSPRPHVQALPRRRERREPWLTQTLSTAAAPRRQNAR
jgi:hypothetical protein